MFRKTWQLIDWWGNIACRTGGFECSRSRIRGLGVETFPAREERKDSKKEMTKGGDESGLAKRGHASTHSALSVGSLRSARASNKKKRKERLLPGRGERQG